MRLSEFIATFQGHIIVEAVAFARTLATFTEADEAIVRDHIPEMLGVIVADLSDSQSRAASVAKSHGLAAAAATLTNADLHGRHRAQSGLSIELLVAEYRALRASVLRLWSERFAPDQDAIRDISRFNEAVDQAIAESVRAFATETETRRQYYLATLGHDLRGPLSAILLTSQVIGLKAQPPISAHAAALTRTAKRMAALLDSLLELNIAGLGGAMTLDKHAADLRPECQEEVEILSAAFPQASIEFASAGDCRGDFDASRVREALSNLISNAVKHGAPREPIRVCLDGEDASVRLSVVNAIDDPIPEGELELLFDPLRRRAGQMDGGERSSLGLGLFITREIAKAHGGEATAACQGDAITFTLVIPKSPP